MPWHFSQKYFIIIPKSKQKCGTRTHLPILHIYNIKAVLSLNIYSSNTINHTKMLGKPFFHIFNFINMKFDSMSGNRIQPFIIIEVHANLRNMTSSLGHVDRLLLFIVKLYAEEM